MKVKVEKKEENNLKGVNSGKNIEYYLVKTNPSDGAEEVSS